MSPLPSWVNEHMKANLRASAKNPLDKCTIISIFPYPIAEKKAMDPEWYRIDKGSFNNPSFTVVGGASSFRHMSDTNQTIEIPISSVSVAQSVVYDWIIGVLECTPGVAQPGLFFLPGEWNLPKIKADKDAFEYLQKHEQMQRAWYVKLIDMADALWGRAPNPRMISELMKIAAEEMSMKDKPWMQNYTTAKMSNCPACGHLCMPGFPVCGNCKHVIDPTAYAALQKAPVATATK